MIDRLKVDLRVPTAMAIGAADILRFRHRLRPDGIHSLRYPALSEPTDKSPGPPWQVGFRDFMWGFSRCGHFLLRLAGIPPRWHPAFFRTLLRRFRVSLPFIVLLVGVLVARPKGEPKKKAKKKIENWPWEGAATVVPPLGNLLTFPNSLYLRSRAGRPLHWAHGDGDPPSDEYMAIDRCGVFSHARPDPPSRRNPLTSL